MEAFAGEGGMIPEQVWDSADIPERGLYPGRPTGSAMPLAWAHAEYLKLRRSLLDNRVFDMPPQTVKRYLVEKVESPFAICALTTVAARSPPARYFGSRSGSPPYPLGRGRCVGPPGGPERDAGLGVHVADLPTANLASGATVRFILSWPEGHWLERKNLDAIESSVVSVS